MWESVAIAEPSDRWAELDETGWDALIAWAAGPQNLRRYPNSDASRTVSTTRARGDATDHFDEPFTETDRQIVDDSVDAYLADAGIPARPRGYRWFLRVPDAYESAHTFHREVHAAINSVEPPSHPHPRNWRPLIEEVIAALYSLPEGTDADQRRKGDDR
ncbi:DUF5956 family protein [Pseudarthrobacter oxydans]|jgi:hypothetical protein|uniref:DUF5956 family protein n=1 Tax=Pseudarthrobacter TaxID=1742993 RepID=UPI001CC777CE|nr:hypothetical protein NicSoilB11_42070 [Arthrobacter sp. NicSoilB11]